MLHVIEKEKEKFRALLHVSAKDGREDLEQVFFDHMLNFSTL